MDISCVEPESDEPHLELPALNDALDRLAQKDSRKAELVKLRYFAGLTNEQAAQSLGINARTAYADWRYARAWLRAEITAGDSGAGE